MYLNTMPFVIIAQQADSIIFSNKFIPVVNFVAIKKLVDLLNTLFLNWTSNSKQLNLSKV